MFLFTTAQNRPALPRHRGAGVVDAIRQGAERTGVGFDYLLATAQRESALDPARRRRTSSASRPLPVHRADLARADQERGREGRACRTMRRRSRPGRTARTRSSDPALQAGDPRAAAGSAGRLRDGGRADAEEPRALGVGARPRATGADLYVAHFLGRAARADLIRAAERNPEPRHRRPTSPMPRPPTARSSSTATAARAAPARSMRSSPKATPRRRRGAGLRAGPAARLRAGRRSRLPRPVPDRRAARTRVRGRRQDLEDRARRSGRADGSPELLPDAAPARSRRPTARLAAPVRAPLAVPLPPPRPDPAPCRKAGRAARPHRLHEVAQAMIIIRHFLLWARTAPDDQRIGGRRRLGEGLSLFRTRSLGAARSRTRAPRHGGRSGPRASAWPWPSALPLGRRAAAP